jgi:hypothetical protein
VTEGGGSSRRPFEPHLMRRRHLENTSPQIDRGRRVSRWAPLTGAPRSPPFPGLQPLTRHGADVLQPRQAPWSILLGPCGSDPFRLCRGALPLLNPIHLGLKKGRPHVARSWNGCNACLTQHDWRLSPRIATSSFFLGGPFGFAILRPEVEQHPNRRGSLAKRVRSGSIRSECKSIFLPPASIPAS